MSLHPFGIGVLGTGIMGRRMIAALGDHPRFRVVAMWDPDVDALDRAAQDVPDARIATSLDDLVADPAVDAVYVASPPAHHVGAVRTIVAGRRPCLCEKPLTSDVAQAHELRALVAASGLPFAVNFPFARSPAARRLVALVREGALGTVVDASIRLRFARWPRAWQAGASPWLSGATEGGFTREVLSHFVFLALRAFGPAVVSDVRIDREAGRAETALVASLVHAGTTVTIDAAVGGDIADDNRFAIVGRDRRVALSGWSRLEVDGRTADESTLPPDTLDAFAALLEGRADHGLATVDEALAVVECIESMARAT